MGRRDDPTEERAFAEVLAVLAGGPRPALDAGSDKVLRTVLGLGGTDTAISCDALVVHPVESPRRRGHPFFRRFGPPMVGALLERAGASRVTGPSVMGIPASEISAEAGGRGWRCDACRVWIAPTAASVTIFVRPTSDSAAQICVQSAPASGPLALPEPAPAWEPRLVFRDFAVPRVCAHCAAPATRFRDLGSALVCARCARSFPAP
jgi:hypothetical protein